MKCLRTLRHRAVGLLAVALLILVSALPGAAQGTELSVEQAFLQLWPEYDDPGLLVIFSGDFADPAAFPRQVAFPVAAEARNIQATTNDPVRGLLSELWQLDGNKLTYTLVRPGFQIEYYVDRPPSGNRREIRHTFEVPYPIRSLEIAVQQPARATDFTVMPQPAGTVVRDDGLTYHVIEQEHLKAGDALDIAISYTKADSALTAPQLAVPSGTSSAQPVAPATVRPTTNWLAYLLIGLGLLALLGLGVYWLWLRRPAAGASPTAKKTRPAATGQTMAYPTVTAGAAFCAQCGRPFRPEDRFCAQCGAPRKG